MVKKTSLLATQGKPQVYSKRKGILFLLPGIYPCVTAGIEIFHYYFVQAIAKYYKVFVSIVMTKSIGFVAAEGPKNDCQTKLDGR